jgi:hypothetical protein
MGLNGPAMAKASMPAVVIVPPLSVSREDMGAGISERCDRFAIRGSWLVSRVRGHVPERARTGPTIGKSDAMDKALADFAELCADRNELDYAELNAAVKSGRVKTETGLWRA